MTFKYIPTTTGFSLSAAPASDDLQLIIDFSNDRHHMITLKMGRPATEIASDLQDLAERLYRDDHLMPPLPPSCTGHKGRP